MLTAWLGNIIDSSSVAMVTFVGHSLSNSVHPLDIYNVTFLVDSHVCDQRNNSMFSKRLREHVVRAPPFSLHIGHFGELLEDGGSGRKGRSFIELTWSHLFMFTFVAFSFGAMKKKKLYFKNKNHLV